MDHEPSPIADTATLAARAWVPADSGRSGALDLNDYLISHPAATFFLRVTSDNMSGAGIFKNDILIVDRALTPKHNQLVIAAVDNELMIKRLYRQNNLTELRSGNPSHPPIRVRGEMELTIWGVVTGVARKL